MKFNIYHNGKFIKIFRAHNKRSADQECREVEAEYRLTKYTVKAVAYVEDKEFKW